MEKKEASSANGVGLTGCLHVGECNRPINITLHKTQLQVHQRPQHKTRYTYTYICNVYFNNIAVSSGDSEGLQTKE